MDTEFVFPRLQNLAAYGAPDTAEFAAAYAFAKNSRFFGAAPADSGSEKGLICDISGYADCGGMPADRRLSFTVAFGRLRSSFTKSRTKERSSAERPERVSWRT